MSSQPEHESAVNIVAMARGRRVCLGVTRSHAAGAWIVWVSVFGNDIEAISGWREFAQAKATLARYEAALRKGHQRFLEEVARGQAADGYAAGHLGDVEIEALKRVATAAIGLASSFR